MTQFQLFFIENEAILRLSSFVIMLFILMGLQLIWPRRLPEQGSWYRQVSNFLLLIIDIIAVRLFVPLALFDVAVYVSENDIGLFNFVKIPLLVNVALTLIIFDLLIYVQHVITHKVNLFWRIHRVHHIDHEVDVTTGVRFHPFEIVLSVLYKMLAVALLGPVAFAIIFYEILLNAAALFTHSNILLNPGLDRFLRMLIVTPDMHRIHHSALREETDSNYGNIFSVWDKLFKTYRLFPKAGYDAMVIGLKEFRAPASGQLLQLLKTPFIA
ncbi:MAG: sterol desaturase [marine bacterium B5-7]|nr:MAG: sterol desaturase [marine bacterium B5-7]